MGKNTNGPTIEQQDDWHDALRDQAEAAVLTGMAERTAARAAVASAAADQRRLDIANLRFYARLFRQYGWGTDVVHWSEVEKTLTEVAQRLEQQSEQSAQEPQ